jgi:phenylacetate-CoA ligase
MRDAAPIGQFQLVQKSLEAVEMRYVADRELTASEQEALAAVVSKAIGHPFRILFARMAAIARSPSGKYEDFVCEVGERGA